MAASPTVSAARSSLYVGDLHPSVEKSDLRNVFSTIGDVSSVKVCKDMLTGLSLCYGYVNFVKSEDAPLAIERLNNTPLKGKIIRVMFSDHTAAEARKNGIGNLFVKNLDESIDNVKLYDIFSKYGKISSCKVALGVNGKSKCYGFVQFESEDSANTAIEQVNGSIIEGKKIFVGPFIKKADRVSSAEAKLTNLYMKNLDKDLTEEFVKEKFSAFGRLSSLAILKDHFGNSRGVGFVNFERPDSARKALQEMNGAQLGSKSIYVSWAEKKEDRQQMLFHHFGESREERLERYKGLNVYIKNIHNHVTDQELWELFGQCGPIHSLSIMRDEKGLSKGYGFVCFSTLEGAQTAVNGLHGSILYGRPLYVAIAEKKEERLAKWHLQYAKKLEAINLADAALFSGEYPPAAYYPNSSGMVTHIPQQSLMYHEQALGLGQDWLDLDGLNDLSISDSPRQQWQQNRNRMNTDVHFAGGQAVPLMQHFHPEARMGSSYQQAGRNNFEGYGQRRGMNNNRPASSSSSQERSKSIRQQHQKQVLGERLYPLVKKHQNALAAKITGMLLEMNNSALYLLLESPETLRAKVEEAVKVLQIAKTKVPGQDSFRPKNFSAGSGVAKQ